MEAHGKHVDVTVLVHGPFTVLKGENILTCRSADYICYLCVLHVISNRHTKILGSAKDFFCFYSYFRDDAIFHQP